MQLKRISILIATVLAVTLVQVPQSNADEINRIFGWTDKTGMTLIDHNVVYGPGGVPCPTESFTSSCDPKSKQLTVVTALGPCSEFKGGCIYEVWMQDDSGIYQKGVQEGERVKPQRDYYWDDKTIPGIARAHASNIYSFPGVSHSGGNLYEVIPMHESLVKPGQSAQSVNLSLSINPIFLDSNSPSRSAGCMTFIESNSWPAKVPCWRVGKDSQNRKIRVTLSLPTLPYGWVTGRITNVSLSTSESSESNLGSLLTISGRSSRVSNIMKNFLSSSSEDKATWTSLSKALNMDAWEKPYSLGSYYPPQTLDSYISLLKKFPWLDSATSDAQQWVANFKWNADQNTLSGCYSSALIGYVGSNAMTFDSEIPRYKPSDHTLEYRVASPHFFADGSVSMGQYELVLNQSIAKCIWNVKDLPSIASLEVLSNDGTTKVATSVFQTVGNYLRFNSSGFTYSSSTIKVSLDTTRSGVTLNAPEKEVFATTETSSTPVTNPSPLPSPTKTPEVVQTIKPSPTPSSKITNLICFKKAKKLIVKKAPFKCPTGYTSKK